MGLSNTATPIYYGQFRDAVIRGDIPVNEELSLEMNRIDALIDDPNIWYDENAMTGFVHFCEMELTLTTGEDLHLLDSFLLWSEQVFGWYYFEERSIYVPYPDNRGGEYVTKRIRKRLTNRQFLIVGRGAAKSMYATCIQAYYLTVDTSTTQQITTAPTMRQAEEVTSPLKTAIARAKGPYFAFLTEGSVHNTTGSKAEQVKLVSTKKGIENKLTNSILEIRPMSIDKLQGARCKIATVDEWLSGDVRENPIEALEQSASKIPDYLILAISSEGTVRNASGDDVKMELMKILRNEMPDPHTSIFWYKLDSLNEINDPSKWIKANPNLGKTVGYDVYQREVSKAENIPSERNDIIAKRFGIPMEGYTYFFTYDETKKHRHRTFWKMPCSLGADLSQGDDFCSFSFLFPLPRDGFGIKTRNYITSTTLANLHPSMRRKYDEFIAEGSLIVLEGVILDMMVVYEDLERYIEDCDYDVVCFGYDPYGAKEFVDRWEREHGSFGVGKVIQGARTESVPLGELKKLAENRMLLFDEDLMSFAMGNCIVIEDTNGNRKLSKRRREDKIDAVAATMDAFVMYKLNRDCFE